MTPLTDFLDKVEAQIVSSAKKDQMEIRLERDDRGQYPSLTIRPIKIFKFEEDSVQRKTAGRKKR